MEITLELHFAFVRYFFTSQLRYLFVRCTYVCLRPHNYVIFCDTFELLMEMTWQLRFVFVRHCGVFFITSQIRYLFGRCSYVFWWRESYVLFWYLRVTYRNNVRVTFLFCWSWYCIFYCITSMLFICLV